MNKQTWLCKCRRIGIPKAEAKARLPTRVVVRGYKTMKTCLSLAKNAWLSAQKKFDILTFYSALKDIKALLNEKKTILAKNEMNLNIIKICALQRIFQFRKSNKKSLGISWHFEIPTY